MPSYFVDSSGVAKLYHAELGTESMDAIANNPESLMYISRLTAVEFVSIFGIKARTGFIGKADAQRVVARFRQDIHIRKFIVAPLREAEFAAAEDLIDKYALDYRLRTLDALQLAVARTLSVGGMLDRFVAADKVLCEIAAKEGLQVINPEVA